LNLSYETAALRHYLATLMPCGEAIWIAMPLPRDGDLD
jgi:hypothetical protein